MSLESVSRNQHNVSSLETDHLNNVGIDIKELLFGKSPLDFKTLGISCRPDQTWVPLSVSLSRSSSQGSQAGGCKVILWFLFLSSPGPKPSFPKPPRPNPNQVQPSSKPKLVPMGLGLALKSYQNASLQGREFSARRTQCRTWWNSPALFLIQSITSI